MIAKRQRLAVTTAIALVTIGLLVSCKRPPDESPATAHGSNHAGQVSGDARTVVELSEHARSMGSVETVAVEPRKLEAEVRAVGKIQPNETSLAAVVSRVDGYVERLFVNFTGVEVNKGDHLIEIYSPDLVVAQQELLLPGGALRDTNLVESTRLKMLRLGLTASQIDELLKNRKVTDRVTLYSPIQGTVLEKFVVQNSAVKAGDVLYRLANLESVWAYVDIYEYELEWVQYGREAELRTESYPGETFAGRVWFISPVVNEETRTIKVLVNIQNRDERLKPGMYVSATLRVPLMKTGRAAPTGVEGQWTCPMHPGVVQAARGKCPICGMELVQIPGNPGTTADEQLALSVPITAVLDSGVRKLVYVERAPGQYAPAEVTLGPRAGQFYPVVKGLDGGERVVVRGNFLLDSQFQIQGLASLFYPTGQVAGGPGHQHSGSTGPKTAAPQTQHKH